MKAALLACPACQRWCSQFAASCPNCGHPISPVPADASRKVSTWVATAAFMTMIAVLSTLSMHWLSPTDVVGGGDEVQEAFAAVRLVFERSNYALWAAAILLWLPALRGIRFRR